jgi:hypothetical protein
VAQFKLRKRCLELSAFAQLWYRALLLNDLFLPPARSTLSDMDRSSSCFDGNQRRHQTITARRNSPSFTIHRTDYVRAPQRYCSWNRVCQNSAMQVSCQGGLIAQPACITCMLRDETRYSKCLSQTRSCRCVHNSGSEASPKSSSDIIC